MSPISAQKTVSITLDNDDCETMKRLLTFAASELSRWGTAPPSLHGYTDIQVSNVRRLIAELKGSL